MKERDKYSSHYAVVSIIAGFFLIIACDRSLVAALTSSSPSSPQYDRQQDDPRQTIIPSPSSSSSLIISEGSLRDMQVSSTMATKPGSTPGFYNPKRRIGRDVVVLSVAQWLAAETKRRAAKDKVSNLKTGDSSSASSDLTPRPVRLLDATCATGIQGLRCMVESPILANAIMSKNGYEHPNMEEDGVQNAQNDIHQNIKDPPELQLVLNDMDSNAIEITRCNVHSVREQMMNNEVDSSSNYSNDVNTIDLMNINITQRVAQAIMHEETFEISVLDPFGSVQPFLDAALSRAPQGGLIEICATDVGVLYGSRPSVASRHYHVNLSNKRPPCYRERGVRLLFAAIAQAAGRHDRGVEPVHGISTEHFCLVSMRVLRGAKAADSSVRQVKSVRICRTCGDSGIGTELDCGCEPIDGAGINADEEGPLWIGPLHDLDTVEQMAEIACLEEAKGFIAPETRDFLQKLKEEAAIQTMFHRRPGIAAEGRTPKLTQVMEELQRSGFKTARTQFCAKSLKSEASVKEFDAAVKAVVT